MVLRFLTAKAGTTGRIGHRCRGYAAGRRRRWHRAGCCEDRHAGEKRKCRGRKKREGRLGPVVGIPSHIRRVLRPRARGEKVRDSNGRIRFSANADRVEFLNARFPPQHSPPLFRAGFRGCGAIGALSVRFPPQHDLLLFWAGFRGCGAIEVLSVRFPSQHSPPLFRAGFRGCGAIEVLSVRFPPQHGAPLFRVGFRGCGAIEVLSVRFPPQHHRPYIRAGFRGCGAIEVPFVRFPPQHGLPLFRAGFRVCLRSCLRDYGAAAYFPARLRSTSCSSILRKRMARGVTSTYSSSLMYSSASSSVKILGGTITAL